MTEVKGIKIINAPGVGGWEIVIYTLDRESELGMQSQRFYFDYADRAQIAKFYSDIGTMLTSPQKSDGWFRKWRSE